MQEIHSMGGGRFFGGGGGGDRRLRPHHHHNNNHQALKCPRCDSLNTKFCYYNNYNLSQPRHFCKNCRRYWTKGGVLRNVPVGGGCRKSKRSNNSNNKPPKNSSSETSATPTPAPPDPNTNSHSSSESSSLTATTEAVSAPAFNSDNSNNNNNNNNLLDNMHESKLLIHQNPSSNPALETATLEQQGTGDCGIFSEIGSFTSLITSANDALPFGFGSTIPDASSFQWQHQKGMAMTMTMSGHHHDDGELKFPDNLGGGGSLLDQTTVPVDLSALQNKTGHGGFGSLDWHGGADQGLFDLSNTVDQPYWTHTHWSDHDNSTLFHLP